MATDVGAPRGFSRVVMPRSLEFFKSGVVLSQKASRRPRGTSGLNVLNLGEPGPKSSSRFVGPNHMVGLRCNLLLSDLLSVS